VSIFLIVGAGLLALYGCAHAVWAVRADEPRYVIVQGIAFVELGLALVVLHSFPVGLVRLALGTALAVSALVSVGIQHKLMRDWKNQQRAIDGT
jgi:hypothetical protein